MVNWKERITSDPKILGGKPVISGTRVSVELILENLAMGLGVEEILKSFPFLARDDVLAALAYASEVTGEKVAVAGGASR